MAQTKETRKTPTTPGRSRLVPDFGPDLGPWAAVLTLSLLLAACGGRPTPLAGGDGGHAEPDIQVPTADGTPGVPPVIPPTIPPGGCVVAIRIDTCCTPAHPAPAQMVAQDPCLVLYPPTYPIDKACKAKWPKMCEGIDCASRPPVSRVAMAVPGGSCAWKAECATAADCRLAYDARRCCDCAKPWPFELVKAQPCIHDYLINGPPPKHCSGGQCASVKCKPCPGPPAAAACIVSGTPGIKVCKAAAP